MSQQFDENRNELQDINNNEQQDVKNNEQINNNEIVNDQQINNDEINRYTNQFNNKKKEQKENNIRIVMHKYNLNILKQKPIEFNQSDSDSDDSDIYDSDIYDYDIQYKTQQKKLNNNFKKEEQHQLLNQQNQKLQYQIKQDKLLEYQLIDQFSECSLIQSLNGKDIDQQELEQHKNCLDIMECQFCNKKYTFCQFQSHLYEEHKEFYCFNCGLFDPQMTNQNHRLRCFQLTQFGFDDAKIQQLDSQEYIFSFTPRLD